MSGMILISLTACVDKTAELEALMNKAQSSVGSCEALKVGQKFAENHEMESVEVFQAWETKCLDEKVAAKMSQLKEARELVKQGKSCAAQVKFTQAETAPPQGLAEKCQAIKLTSAQDKIKQLIKEGDWCSAENHAEKLSPNHRPLPLVKLKQQCKSSKDAIKFN